MRLEAGKTFRQWTVMDCGAKARVTHVVWVDEDSAQYCKALLRDGRVYLNDNSELAKETIQAAHILIEPKHKMIYIIH